MQAARPVQRIATTMQCLSRPLAAAPCGTARPARPPTTRLRAAAAPGAPEAAPEEPKPLRVSMVR